MDRLDLYRIFARVVETRSFTRAAARIGVAQSTLSHAIKQPVGSGLIPKNGDDGRRVKDHLGSPVASS